MNPDNFEQQLAIFMQDMDARNHYRQLVIELWQWLTEQRLRHAKSLMTVSPVVVGIAGAQGTGKTTLANLLVLFGKEQGVAVGTVSLDDYYLSQSQRAILAAKVHPLLLQRGMPGTHAIDQAIADAKAVRKGSPICLPYFDKALDQPGLQRSSQRFEMLIVEGWCLGLTPQVEDELTLAVNLLESREDSTGCWRFFVNQQLALNYQAYWQLCQPVIWLKAPDWPSICRWRVIQEQQLWQLRGQGMSDITLARFMQSFQRLTEHSFQVMRATADIVIELDEQQRPTIIKPLP